MKIMNRIFSVVAAAALAAGLLAGCGASSAAGSTASSAVSSVAASSEAASSEAASAEASEAKVKAQFTVTGADGESQTFDLEVTDGEKLSDALAEAGIISADEAAAGFVTTVNGDADLRNLIQALNMVHGNHPFSFSKLAMKATSFSTPSTGMAL